MSRVRPPLASRVLSRVHKDDDSGFTMLAVIVSGVLVLGLVMVAITFAIVAQRASRASADTKSALSAAQAGVQDYISRMNACEDYFNFPNESCGTSTANAAIRTAVGSRNVAIVPGTSGAEQAVFSQRVLSKPTDTNNTSTYVRVEVIGQVINTQTKQVRESKTLVADIGRGGFLDFLYFTTYETFSPSNTRLLTSEFTAKGNGSTVTLRKIDGSTNTRSQSLATNTTYTITQPTVDAVAAGCERYYYDGRDTFPRRVTGGTIPVTEEWYYWPSGASSALGGIANYQCLTISFSGADTFNGPVHSNDAMRMSGPVNFKQAVTTGWNKAPKPWYGDADPSNQKPSFTGTQEMPATTDVQRTVAQTNGCLYTGPTSIKFTSDGKMTVRSPLTQSKSVNSSCTSAPGSNAYMTGDQVVSGPANGVVYVQQSTATIGTCLSFQSTAKDITAYDNSNCTRGDAFVQGTVKGRFTVAAEHDVVVTDDIVYNGGLGGKDVLGLIATNNVAVWHPVDSGGNNLTAKGNRRIDAAIASVGNSFTVFNYSAGAKMGDLTINGVIVQKYRGPVATGSGSITSTGYSKDYNYDKRLPSLPPPAFIEPVKDSWDLKLVTDQQTPRTNPSDYPSPDPTP